MRCFTVVKMKKPLLAATAKDLTATAFLAHRLCNGKAISTIYNEAQKAARVILSASFLIFWPHGCTQEEWVRSTRRKEYGKFAATESHLPYATQRQF